MTTSFNKAHGGSNPRPHTLEANGLTNPPTVCGSYIGERNHIYGVYYLIFQNTRVVEGQTHDLWHGYTTNYQHASGFTFEHNSKTLYLKRKDMLSNKWVVTGRFEPAPIGSKPNDLIVGLLHSMFKPKD